MGKCQGGFCTDRIVKIISRETGMDISSITKRGRGTYLARNRIGDFEVKDEYSRV